MPNPPSSCITPSEGKALCDQWTNTRAQYIKTAEGYDDTCEFNMSVADLQAYLDYVVAESSAQGITDPGVRIYFAAYSQGSQPKATLVMAPTMSGDPGADNNYSIQPANRQTGRIPPRAYNPGQ